MRATKYVSFVLLVMLSSVCFVTCSGTQDKDDKEQIRLQGTPEAVIKK